MQIPQASRIVFACDAWHAMTSDRPYRAALDPATALAELRRGAGSQFDPEVVAALLDVLGEEVRQAADLRGVAGNGRIDALAGAGSRAAASAKISAPAPLAARTHAH